MKDYLKSVGLWGCGCPVDTSAAGRSTDRADRRDQLHYQYLKETRPCLIGVMRMTGELISYLQDINKQADELNYKLVKEYAKREGVTEKLKAENQMAWVGAMNNIQSRVREIIFNDIIYQ